MAADQSDRLKTQPIINIVGEKVALGPHRRDLLPLCWSWYNDFEIRRTLTADFRPTTWEAVVAGYEGAINDRSNVRFAIYEKATMRPIGIGGLCDIDHIQRTASMDIMIGAKDCWNKGFGTEATILMLDHGFHGLGLHNIWIDPYSYNERAIRSYKRAGFKEIGRRRQAHRAGNQAYDIVYMDCLATEFESLVMRQYLPQ